MNHRWKSNIVSTLSIVAIAFFSLTCSSSKKNQTDKEFSPETETISDSQNSIDSLGGDSTTQPGEVETENIESDIFYQTNTVPLEPTKDCIHPRVNKDCNNDWCHIPKGCFIFGSIDSEGNFCRAKYAEDQAQVTLTHDFEISQYETTQADWQAVGFDLPNPLVKMPCPDCPIGWITIYEAMEYCNALSRKEGISECYDLTNCRGGIASGCPDSDDPKDAWGCLDDSAYICTGKVQQFSDPYLCPGFRLPTTAEWEYAARAGTITATYNGDFEDNIAEACLSNATVDSIAWHCGNTDAAQEKPQYITVGQKNPNGFGLYDMLGNAGEYCASTQYNRSLNNLLNQDGALVDPAPPLEEYDGNMDVVLRGSFYMHAPCYARSAYGSPGVRAGERVAYRGFRPVRTLNLGADLSRNRK